MSSRWATTARAYAGRDLIGECRLIKVDRALAVGDVFIYSEGTEDPVAQATGTYSIPSEGRAPTQETKRDPSP